MRCKFDSLWNYGRYAIGDALLSNNKIEELNRIDELGLTSSVIRTYDELKDTASSTITALLGHQSIQKRQGELNALLQDEIYRRIAKGDFTLWTKNNPSLISKISKNTHAATPCSSLLAKLLKIRFENPKTKHHPVPDDLFLLALEKAREKHLFVMENCDEKAITANGLIRPHGGNWFGYINLADSVCRTDNPQIILFIRTQMDSDEYKGAFGNGLVDSILQHFAYKTLEHISKTDPLFAFRDRVYNKNHHLPIQHRNYFSDPENPIEKRNPLQSLFTPDKMNHWLDNEEAARCMLKVLYNAGKTVLPNNKHSQWENAFELEQFTEPQIRVLMINVLNAVEELKVSINLEPEIYTSAKNTDNKNSRKKTCFS